MCIYLCQEYEGILLILCAPCVMVDHMLRHKTDMVRLVVSMRACFSIRGGVCDTQEIQGKPRESLGIS